MSQEIRKVLPVDVHHQKETDAILSKTFDPPSSTTFLVSRSIDVFPTLIIMSLSPKKKQNEVQNIHGQIVPISY